MFSEILLEILPGALSVGSNSILGSICSIYLCKGSSSHIRQDPSYFGRIIRELGRVSCDVELESEYP